MTTDYLTSDSGNDLDLDFEVAPNVGQPTREELDDCAVRLERILRTFRIRGKVLSSRDQCSIIQRLGRKQEAENLREQYLKEGATSEEAAAEVVAVEYWGEGEVFSAMMESQMNSGRSPQEVRHAYVSGVARSQGFHAEVDRMLENDPELRPLVEEEYPVLPEGEISLTAFPPNQEIPLQTPPKRV